MPDVLLLAGPTGLLAPVLCLVPVTHRRSDDAPRVASGGSSRRRLAPLLLLGVVMISEILLALVLAWLFSASPSFALGLNGFNGPAAITIASLATIPGLMLLAAARSVSHVTAPARAAPLAQ